MKVIRVPWIRCRADESGAEVFSIEWGDQTVDIMAYNEHEARDWWRGLGESERRSVAGGGGNSDADSGGFDLF